jgi:hypothetical protein
MPIQSDHCANCGARLTAHRTSLREIVAAAVCSSFLLAVLTLAGFIGYRWIELQQQRIFIYPFWHEPLESWTR